MTRSPVRLLFGGVCLLVAMASLVAQPARHRLTLDDLGTFHEVRDPQLSPDGQSVAYVVSTVDVRADKTNTHIWLASYDGQSNRQLTFSQDSESSPRWSPDGKYLAFTSSRPGPAKGNQVWLLDRSGGEAFQLTDTKGRLQSFEWSPDSKRLALVIGDPDPDADATPDAGSPSAGPTAPPTASVTQSSAPAASASRAPKPIVIDRYKYKQDVQGYLLTGRHNFIYLFDIPSRKTERLTNGLSDESNPRWSPDGTRIAYLDNHSADPDRDASVQIFVAASVPSSPETRLTPVDRRLSRLPLRWSPDGTTILFLEGDEKKFDAYEMQHLTLVRADGTSAPQRLPAVDGLDRGITLPAFSTDGSSLRFLVTDDRSVYPARVGLRDGRVERLAQPPVVLSNWDAAGDHIVGLSGTDTRPTEVYALENGSLRQVSHQNDAWATSLDIGATEEVSFKSKDGTEVHGLLTKPAGYATGTKVPLLLRIHGGPNGQDAHTFSFERQWFAANGYAVLAVNYRGSAGRGQKFSRAIVADWGHFEVEDLRAGVDYVIAIGVADPDRLGVGGWSYGGILTDYMIASDPRFKAATSGAGTAFTVSFYGTDQYIIQYDYEIGPPWDPIAWETYQKISYPFLHANRIKTPTLFLGGERDFNVPVQGSQQMYEALKSLSVDTQLVIYPEQFHEIARPSYIRDRLQRYVAWYDKYLKPTTMTTAQK
jgi:dipeptidyl aminopeptidase/acylaminoacyl peptidase